MMYGSHTLENAHQTLAAELLELVAAAERADLRDLVAALGVAREAALLRLMTVEPTRILTPSEAAEVVGMPERRLRSLARGKSWALRLGGALRIDEAAMLRWARCSGRAGKRAEPAPSGPCDVQGEQKTAQPRGVGALRDMKH